MNSCSDTTCAVPKKKTPRLTDKLKIAPHHLCTPKRQKITAIKSINYSN